MRDLPPIGSRVRRACPLGTHCWGDNCCPSPLHRDGWVIADETSSQHANGVLKCTRSGSQRTDGKLLQRADYAGTNDDGADQQRSGDDHY